MKYNSGDLTTFSSAFQRPLVQATQFIAKMQRENNAKVMDLVVNERKEQKAKQAILDREYKALHEDADNLGKHAGKTYADADGNQVPVVTPDQIKVIHENLDKSRLKNEPARVPNGIFEAQARLTNYDVYNKDFTSANAANEKLAQEFTKEFGYLVNKPVEELTSEEQDYDLNYQQYLSDVDSAKKSNIVMNPWENNSAVFLLGVVRQKKLDREKNEAIYAEKFSSSKSAMDTFFKYFGGSEDDNQTKFESLAGKYQAGIESQEPFDITSDPDAKALMKEVRRIDKANKASGGSGVAAASRQASINSALVDLGGEIENLSDPDIYAAGSEERSLYEDYKVAVEDYENDVMPTRDLVNNFKIRLNKIKGVSPNAKTIAWDDNINDVPNAGTTYTKIRTPEDFNSEIIDPQKKKLDLYNFLITNKDNPKMVVQGAEAYDVKNYVKTLNPPKGKDVWEFITEERDKIKAKYDVMLNTYNKAKANKLGVTK